MRAHRTGKVVLSVVLVTGAVAVTPAGHQVAAAAPRVVINEIHYNPFDGNQNDEYLELLNTTAGDIDLAGWTVEGIDYEFPRGFVVPARGIRTIGGAQFAAFGALSNGGEEIELIDRDGAVVDAVEYDDHDEWPAMADGEGHSLQRRDAASPGDEPGNWVSAPPSPGVANPIRRSGLLPSFSDVEHTDRPKAGAAIAVTAELGDATSATLYYRVGISGSEVAVAMRVDDGVASATIPGQAAGALVRYRMRATSGDRVGTWPRQGDGATYRGTTVARPAPSPLPTFEVFMADETYQVMVNDLTLRGDDGYPMVLAYEGQVFDNARIRVKGQVSRQFPKKKFKVILPPGYTIEDDDQFPDEVDEFAIHSGWSDRSLIRETLASEFMVAADALGAQQAFPARIERNGAFYGLYTYVEQPDGTWRDRYGLDDSESYEVGPDNVFGMLSPVDVGLSQEVLRRRYDKETFEYLDDRRLRDFIATVNGLAGPAEREWIYANVDVPSVVNALATSMVIQHQDWGHKNYRLIFDEHGRVRVTQNDFDLVFGRRWSVDTGPLNTAVGIGGAFEHPGGPFFLTFFTDPELASMVQRRVRTLTEELLNPNVLGPRIGAVAAYVRNDALSDRAVWGTYGGVADPTDEANRIVSAFVAPQYARLLGPLAAQGRVARTPQPDVPAVSIVHVGYDGLEQVVLRNLSGDTVDLSGFEIPELDTVVAGGTVVLPGREVVLVHEDAAQLAGAFPGRLVVGLFDESLADAEDGITLRNRRGVAVSAWSLMPPGNESELSARADSSALVSLVATQTGGPGFLQLLACGSKPGATSNLNVDAFGQTRAVLALAAFDADGTTCLYNRSATHAVVDLQGYFADGAVDDVADDRLLDTRSGTRPAAASRVRITGGEPDRTGIVSLVATGGSGAGFVSVVACDSTGTPSTSNLNVDAAGKTVAALAFVRFDADGEACLYTSAASHLIADVQGYLAPDAFDDVADDRLLDTRSDGTPLTRQLVTLRGRPDSTGVVSVVATQTTGPGYLQVLACDARPGATSNVNYDAAGATVSNLATVAFDADGEACISVRTPARVVVDLQGYFADGAFDDVTDRRLFDSRP